MKTKIDYKQFVRENIIESDISYRGGTLKVRARELFPKVSNPIVGAYQNYLGGGMAGAIQGAAMFDPSELSKRDQGKFVKLLEACKQVFFEINNGGGDEYMQENHASYGFNQNLPKSGY